MELSEFYTRMRREVAAYLQPGRDASVTFLVWFLVNYFRLEMEDAIDCVCDHTNDKGIDGIHVDDEGETIYVFQSKFSPEDDNVQGDVDLRSLVGALTWFQDEASVDRLLASTASHELRSLVTRTGIRSRTQFRVTPVFVTNKRFDVRAREYTEGFPELDAFERDRLFKEYTYFCDEEIDKPSVDLSISNTSRIDYSLLDGALVRVYSIKAKELMNLDGIQDGSLFDRNVRFGIGNTRVNKAIKKTILDAAAHKKFFLFHNGITIVCRTLEDVSDHVIRISGYAVINGCQSMVTFYENRSNLSNNLFLLVKLIKLNVDSPLVREITFSANNQNAINLSDLHSNDAVQKALQRQFGELFPNQLQYVRTRGEPEQSGVTVIHKDFAAQLYESVYLAQPFNTHLKQRLFGDDYAKIFSRSITAPKIAMAWFLHDTVAKRTELLTNSQIRDYGLARFFFASALANVLRKDPLGTNIIDNPEEYVTAHADQLRKTIDRLWSLLTPDINSDIEEYTTELGFFDYKNLFKNSTFVERFDRKIRTDYERLVRRNTGDSFTNIYASFAPV